MNSSLALNERLSRSNAAQVATAPKARATADTFGAVAEAIPPAAAGWRGTERRRSVVIGVALLHVGAAWVLVHSLRAPEAVVPSAPVEVRLVKPPAPRIEPPAPLRTEVQLPLVAPVPLGQPPAVNVASPVVAVTEPTLPVAAKPAVVAVAAPPARAAAGPREIPASAVHYVVEPQLHVPRMSRRLGESGTVLLHIVVDAGGRLRAAVVRKSSGFERLDRQALLDIRTARFSPYLEKGQPIDWEADAGLQYEVR